MKTIAIMQPYFMPYLGYFQLIQSADKFVVYDNIEYTKKGWFNRNRILVGGSDWLFTIPVKKGSDYLDVNQRFISDDSDREIERLLAVIKNSYKKAPQFEQVYPVIERCLRFGDKNLFAYIFHSIQEVCDYLGITTKFVISSSIAIDHESLKNKDKVLAICRHQEADRYINPIGGQELYEPAFFAEAGIDLRFIKMDGIQYKQFGDNFVPGLSIIDVMMFNDKNEITEMLNRYELI